MENWAHSFRITDQIAHSWTVKSSHRLYVRQCARANSSYLCCRRLFENYYLCTLQSVRKLLLFIIIIRNMMEYQRLLHIIILLLFYMQTFTDKLLYSIHLAGRRNCLIIISPTHNSVVAMPSEPHVEQMQYTDDRAVPRITDRNALIKWQQAVIFLVFLSFFFCKLDSRNV